MKIKKHVALFPCGKRGKTIPPTLPPDHKSQHLLIAVSLTL